MTARPTSQRQEHFVITDENGPESLGRHHGRRGIRLQADETTNVLIESALWDPLTVARTGRDLGIITDARYRFERGVDPAFIGTRARLRHAIW